MQHGDQHVDPEVLALLALGEPADDVADAGQRAHLAACEACRTEVAALADVAATGRSVTDDDALVDPPAGVWASIHAELGLSDAVRDLPAPATTGTTDSGTTDSGTTGSDTTAPVVPLADRRRRYSGTWLAAAAGVALVAGVAGGVLWGGRDAAPVADPSPSATSTGSPSAPPELTVATATLDPLPDWPDATGDARVEEAPDGARSVVVQMQAPPTDGGYREVWLIADDLSGLVSLGVLSGTEGTFPVPDGLDLSTYSLVDVSEEHFDGDPAHSGDSIVRGGLTGA
ncbi:anti-sigma-K factor rskA [Sediminihabitans luteus]|uniref:Anti-sigma-K factor rskA n=1 Tax=Sediminihabitans luteus TaxID=1138585 RepID=A0A2M9D0V7_9CELL|nr:anti-sigma-K factor rskA [Sediminihabitans luteus]